MYKLLIIFLLTFLTYNIINGQENPDVPSGSLDIELLENFNSFFDKIKVRKHF